MASISIITPWLNCPELVRTYERSVNTAEVVIIDNGSELDAAAKIKAMATRQRGIYIRNEANARYAAANNQGLAVATGDIIIFMNNDIEAPPGWLHQVKRDVKDGALYGPSRLWRHVAGSEVPYLEGYCIAATRATWDALGGWDETYQGMYWEDNDLCWRALQMGISLIETNWPVWHYGNYTSKQTAGAYDSSVTNQAMFEGRVQDASHV
jgi:GT2 family glycosyltransferase